MIQMDAREDQGTLFYENELITYIRTYIHIYINNLLEIHLYMHTWSIVKLDGFQFRP